MALHGGVFRYETELLTAFQFEKRLPSYTNYFQYFCPHKIETEITFCGVQSRQTYGSALQCISRMTEGAAGCRRLITTQCYVYGARLRWKGWPSIYDAQPLS